MTPAPLKIGPYTLQSPFVLAPMAGVTDAPFRRICRSYGAGMTTSEMTTADTSLWQTPKSRHRLDLDLDAEPVAVQIAGSEPDQLAIAARACVDRGAQIIDINMGCPAKKVCRKLAGSALLQDEKLVADILAAVVAAVEVPVTLKFRTGWDREHRNALQIARSQRTPAFKRSPFMAELARIGTKARRNTKQLRASKRPWEFPSLPTATSRQ